MSNFDAPLIIQYSKEASEILGGDYWQVKRSFRYRLGWSRWAFVPAGMLTDLGSVPKVFRSIIDNGGGAAQAYVLHDQLCEYLSVTQDGKPEPITRRQADLILHSALIDLEVDRTTATLIYNAVAAYREVMNIRLPSTTMKKRALEAQFSFEGF